MVTGRGGGREGGGGGERRGEVNKKGKERGGEEGCTHERRKTHHWDTKGILRLYMMINISHTYLHIWRL